MKLCSPLATFQSILAICLYQATPKLCHLVWLKSCRTCNLIVLSVADQNISRCDTLGGGGERNLNYLQNPPWPNGDKQGNLGEKE